MFAARWVFVVALAVAAAAQVPPPPLQGQDPQRPEPPKPTYPYRSFTDLTPSWAEAQRLTEVVRSRRVWMRAIPHVPVQLNAYCDVREFPKEVLKVMALPEGARETGRPKDAQQNVWRAGLLDGTELYAAQLLVPVYCYRQLFLLHRDPATGHMATARLDKSGLCDNWYEPPRIQQVDLDGDGRMEVVLDVLHHNGTVENSYRRHYLTMVDSRFRTLLATAVEVKLVDSPNEGGFLHQMPFVDEYGHMAVYTWYENAAVPPGVPVTVPVGFTILAREGADEPYHEAARDSLLPRAECWLGVREADYDQLK